MKHLEFSTPSAKADGKDKKVNTNIFFPCFLFPLPSASADGAKNFEYQNQPKTSKNQLKNP